MPFENYFLINEFKDIFCSGFPANSKKSTVILLTYSISSNNLFYHFVFVLTLSKIWKHFKRFRRIKKCDLVAQRAD